MSFFDKFKKKTTDASVASDSIALRDFERDLIQTVAITMFELKITKQPALSFFHNDHGIFEETFLSHTTDPEFVAMSQQDFATYLMVLGCHALGAAAYVAICQRKYHKPLAEFGNVELREIAQALHNTDPYELGLNALGFRHDGNNKKCLDHIVVTANNAARNLAGNNIHDKRYQKIYMQVLYNAGVTLIYGR